ncbi:hypothetical protein SAMN02744133_108163 [Thalassospira xiamenensis M-5 = DSM 17429]|uniref:Uncharacterized protein n=1 Tax=Thalassospira xiamenensis M-5 = DSM 17429 TaxID=1123366 RepID=A0AB72UK02_9PROT|nr:hypothetical protein [Thalassospira xiamenensis]AJD54435.1 hypothetical protein TH3_21813 [Thalassospira xiamenensis M-5 = DSM 17429]SIT22172.1 hypothetical protein SAMN02744133_108163 [Thalassospira xiamenensis M-5 = DSM 17429]
MKITVDQIIEKFKDGARVLLPDNPGKRAIMLSCAAAIAAGTLAPGQVHANSLSIGEEGVRASAPADEASISKMMLDLEQAIDQQFPEMAGKITIYNFANSMDDNIAHITDRLGKDSEPFVNAMVKEGFRENRSFEEAMREGFSDATNLRQHMAEVVPFSTKGDRNACVVFPSSAIFNFDNHDYPNMVGAGYLVSLAVGHCANNMLYEAAEKRPGTSQADLKDLATVADLTAADWSHNLGYTINWESAVWQLEFANNPEDIRRNNADAIATHAALNHYSGYRNVTTAPEHITFDNIRASFDRAEQTFEAMASRTVGIDQVTQYNYDTAMEDIQAKIEAHFFNEDSFDEKGYRDYLAELSDIPKFASSYETVAHHMINIHERPEVDFTTRANRGTESFEASYAKLTQLSTDHPELDAVVRATADKYVNTFVSRAMLESNDKIDDYRAFEAAATKYFERIAEDPVYAAQVAEGEASLYGTITTGFMPSEFAANVKPNSLNLENDSEPTSPEI